MANEAKYWILANQAAKQLGWLAETIFTQWAWETAHFTSGNLVNNNNIAGQTWYDGCGHDKGSARPANEGGYYIKYANPVDGYVEFIKNNIKRYGNVASAKTVEAQINLIAKDGWAADPNYANGLKALHAANIREGVYNLPYTAISAAPAPKKSVVSPVYHTVVKGENLIKIANVNGTTVSQLVAWNGIKNPSLITPGQKLRVK